jgi:hypothetical protein
MVQFHVYDENFVILDPRDLVVSFSISFLVSQQMIRRLIPQISI